MCLVCLVFGEFVVCLLFVCCLFACLLVFLFVCLFACLLVCLFVCLLACLLARLLACLCVCVFVCLFVCLFLVVGGGELPFIFAELSFACPRIQAAPMATDTVEVQIGTVAL